MPRGAPLPPGPPRAGRVRPPPRGRDLVRPRLARGGVRAAPRPRPPRKKTSGEAGGSQKLEASIDATTAWDAATSRRVSAVGFGGDAWILGWGAVAGSVSASAARRAAA